MSTKIHFMTICIIIASLLLSGCGSAPVSPQGKAQPEATGTPSSAPSVIPPLNPSFTPMPIFTLAPTPIPTSSVLQFGKTISPENTGEITELARRGKGVVTSMSFTPDGKKFIVGASHGIYLYDALTREQVGYIKEDWPSLVTCSPDGKTLAFWAADGSIKIWDLVGDKEILTLTGQKGFRTIMRFSLDGKTLATGSQSESDTSGVLDLTVKLWDISNGKELSTLKGTIPSVGGYFYPVFNLAFLPDGKTLIYGGGSELKLWDIQNSQELRALSLDVGLDDVVVTYALSPDGKTLAIGTLGSYVFWDIGTDKIVQTIRSDGQSSIWKLVFSPDGKMLVIGDGPDYYSIDDQKVSLLDIAAARELHTFEKESSTIFAISPDSKTLSTFSNTGNIELRDVYSGQSLGTLTGYEISNYDNEVIISPDGKMLISRTGSVAKLWDLATGEQGVTFFNINKFSSSMDFSPDGKSLAYINNDEQKIIIWDVSNNQELQTFSNSPSPGSIAFSPDGKMLAVGCSTATILLRDAKNGSEIAHLESTGSWDDVAFSPDGKLLATNQSFSTEILLWDVAKKEKLLTITDDDSYWENMVFSPDSKLLATAAGVDEKIVVWNLSNGRQLFTVTKKGSAGVAFSPDGKILAYGSGTKMVLWDVVNQKELHTFDHLTGEVLSISFSPSGKFIATGVSDGTIGIWGITP